MNHSQTNEDEEETLNTIIQRIDHHGKMLLGESVRLGESSKQKNNPNKEVKLTVSKQFSFSVNTKDGKNFSGNGRTKLLEMSDIYSDNYNRRRKLSRLRSRSETRKKKLPQTRNHFASGSSKPISPSKFDIRIKGPTRELYKFDVDVSPTNKSNEALSIVRKSSVNSVDTEVTQDDNELPRFDGVEVTIKVSEKDKKKSTKKVRQSRLLGHQSLRLAKTNKQSKATGSSTSSNPDRITPSQQKLIDTIMSHIDKRGLSPTLKLHIQNLLSMSRENIRDLGISSSDTSIDSVYMESIDLKQPTTKVPLQNEAQCSNKIAAKSKDLNPEKEELRMEAARKTADIISQYSQLSEMFVKKIENLSKVGSRFDVSFKPNTVNETTGAADQDLSRYPAASTGESSYLNLPPHVNPNLPVNRNLMEAFSSGNRYSPPTPTFDELPEPMYFGPPYFLPYQPHMVSQEVSDNEQGEFYYYYPNNPSQTVQFAYVPMSNNYFVQPEERPHHRETDRRSMPPPTLFNCRFRSGMESSSPPHELTTIPEVDTPKTLGYSDSNIVLEPEEEMLIDVFERLDISQSDHDESSESIKSFDSVSSVPNIVSTLMKRNVVTLPFENERKRKVMQDLQNKESQKNFYAGSLNISSPSYKHQRMNTFSTSGNRNHINHMARNHIAFDNVSIPPMQYMNYRIETTNNMNPFTGLNNKVNDLGNSSSLKPAAKSALVDNTTHEELIEIDNTNQQHAGVSHVSKQACDAFKYVFKNNVYNYQKEDECTESHVKKVFYENHGEISDIEGERLTKFNEIIKDLDEANEIMSDSSPEELRLAFHSLGAGWTGTAHKLQEAQELNSNTTSSTRKGMRRSTKNGIKEKNLSSNWKNEQQNLKSPNVYLRTPIPVSASATDLEKYKARKYIN